MLTKLWLEYKSSTKLQKKRTFKDWDPWWRRMLHKSPISSTNTYRTKIHNFLSSNPLNNHIFHFSGNSIYSITLLRKTWSIISYLSTTWFTLMLWKLRRRKSVISLVFTVCLPQSLTTQNTINWEQLIHTTMFPLLHLSTSSSTMPLFLPKRTISMSSMHSILWKTNPSFK